MGNAGKMLIASRLQAAPESPHPGESISCVGFLK